MLTIATGGVSLGNLQAIADRAVQYDLNTSMLEWWNSSNGYQTLHQDLKIGRNSAWEQGILGAPGNPQAALYVVDDTNPTSPTIQISDMTKFTRQYYKFVRSGAVRIEADSNNGNFDPLAFVNTEGSYVVVVKADASGTFSIQGLPPGTYGIKYTTFSQYDVDLPDVALGGGDVLTTSIPAVGVLTVYAKQSQSLALNGTPGDGVIYLTWAISGTLPSSSTWQIDYRSQTGTLYPAITGIISPTRAYTLTGLSNYAWYTVTLSAMLDSTPFLTDTVRVMPTDRFVYLPVVVRND